MSSHDYTREGSRESWGHSLESGARPPVRARGARANISAILLLVDVVVLAMTLGGLHGPLRFVVGLVFGVVVPGWSIVGLLNLGNAALETGLTVAVSLSLLMVLAQLLMTMHLWHLGALETLMSLACLPSLARQSRPHRPDRTSPS